MNDFKEWLSDYLRYFMLALAALLLFVLIYFGVRIFQNHQAQQEVSGDDVIQILTETDVETEAKTEDVETETEAETEAVTETEGVEEAEIIGESEASKLKDENKSENSGFQSETDVTAKAESEDDDAKSEPEEKQNAVQTQPATDAEIKTTEKKSKAETERTPVIAGNSSTNMPATEKQTESVTGTETMTETESETETEVYVPVYKTLKGSCYIRSGPSMEAEIIGEYMYGTTVEFLEDVGGWYKVQIDGMIGYMGARFF